MASNPIVQKFFKYYSRHESFLNQIKGRAMMIDSTVDEKGMFENLHPPKQTVSILNWKEEKRNYVFPTIFTDTRTICLIYTANYQKVLAQVPKALPKPVRVSPSRCLMMFTLLQYGNVSDGMLGYNEFVIGTFLSLSRIPILPAVFRKQFKSTVFYAFDMPVDSQENCTRGQRIWGLPKTMKNFEIQESERSLGNPGHFYCKVENQGDLSYEMSAPVAGKRWFTKRESTRSVSISEQGQANISDIFLQSDQQLYYTSRSPLANEVSLKVGNNSDCSWINKIELSKTPLCVRHLKNMKSALYSPNNY